MNISEKERDVLVAEDDQDDLYIFKLAIDQLSLAISLRHAKDSHTLFEKLREAVPELLFLDIGMPCKDGISCLLEIRKDARYNEMSVVMFSSYNRPADIKVTYQNGANYFLIKSSSVDLLAEKLRFIFSMLTPRELYFPSLAEYVLTS